MTLAPALAVVIVMGQSALRSLLLGAAVFAASRAARLRDLRAETAIWTAVLLAALAMPLLAQALPCVSLHLPVPTPSPATISVLAVAGGDPVRPFSLPAPGAVLACVYGIGVAVSFARILAGLMLVTALYVRAEPVTEPWARGRAIRASAGVDGPLSFARCILLPANYAGWPQAKLVAVLAHEECHIRRGDFFVQLLASVHRALFWFSPFPWWLQRKLGELAETASDAAGARRIGDAAGYAEILVDVTRQARRSPLRCGSGAGVLAMAHGPTLARRVDHLLSAAPEQALGGAARALSLAAVATASLGLAAVHAALAQGSVAADRLVQSSAPDRASAAGDSGSASRRREPKAPPRTSRSSKRPAATSVATAAAARPVDLDQPTYDPLALVRDNDAVAILPVILAGHGVVRRADD